MHGAELSSYVDSAGGVPPVGSPHPRANPKPLYARLSRLFRKEVSRFLPELIRRWPIALSFPGDVALYRTTVVGSDLNARSAVGTPHQRP